jgi:outer membrane protein assembly factor BamB
MSSKHFSTLWFALPALALSLGVSRSAPAEPVDPMVENAPSFQCSTGTEAHVLRRTELGGEGGPIALGTGKAIAAASTKWSAPSSGLPATNSGAVVCLDAEGKLLWRATHPRLGARIHDMGQPIRSTPCIDGDRVYYVSNRGELVCADVEGFHDGANDGPFDSEETSGPTDADFLWKLDMISELGVYRHEAGDVGNPSSSPVVIGNLVYCVTGHGRTGTLELTYAAQSKGGENVEAPSFLAVHKLTGKVAWSSSAPGRNILLGQWSSPVHARINDADVVIFPGGDGFLYGFEVISGTLLWKFDCNEPGAKNYFVATPVVQGNTLYVGLNRDFEQPTASPLLAIDLVASGGVPRIKWKFQAPAFGSTYTSAAVGEGIVYVSGEQGVLFAIDGATGQELWQSKFEDGRVFFASPVVHDGKVYAGGDSTLAIFAAGREKRCIGHYEFESSGTSTPAFTRDGVIVPAGNSLWTLRLPVSQ